MDIVVIVTAIAVVYSSSTTIMGGLLQSLSLPVLENGGRGSRVYSHPPTVVVGGMTPNAVAATARRVAGVNFEKFFSIHPNMVITFLFGNYSVES